MSLDSYVNIRRNLLQSSLLLELKKYRYLPLHLAVLYLKLATERTYFTLSSHCLTNTVPKESNHPLGLNFIHRSKEFPTGWMSSQTLVDLKLKNPWNMPLDIFKSPLYPGRNYDPDEVEKEKDIIFSRNKNLINKVTYLLKFEVENSLEDRIPFYLVLPYLFLNKTETIISTTQLGQKFELQYDPQNISLRVKDLKGGAKYAKNYKTQKEFLAWYDLYIAMNADGHIDERLHPSQKFDRFYLPS